MTVDAHMRPKIFISSVVNGYEPFREAARRGVERAGAKPVLVNEDQPSSPLSSRNVCLDLVESSDAVVVLVGERGGWTTPSGKLVVEEEVEQAQRRRLPVLAFVQEVSRDPEAERLARVLSDYVRGRFRVTFGTPDQLESAVERAVRELLPTLTAPRTPLQPLQRVVPEVQGVQSQASIRFVLAPERAEEVVDPMRLESKQFRDSVLAVGHRSDVGLFTYERGKRSRIESAALVIHQADEYHGRDAILNTRLEVHESGLVVIDANVTGRVLRGDRFSGMDLSSYVLAEEDLEAVLNACFRFGAAFYDEVDPHLRHQTFFYNVGLDGVGHRTFERNPQPRNSFTIPFSQREGAVPAYPEPRGVPRQSLGDPSQEIQRVVVQLRRSVSRS